MTEAMGKAIESTARRSAGTWAGAITGFVLLAAGSAVASFLGVMLVFVSDSCGSAGECRIALIATGMAVTGLGPWVVFGTALVVAFVRWRQGRLFAWTPWIGIAVAAAVAGGGVLMAFAGAPQGR